MIDRARCPHCLGPIYAPTDSHGERLDCEGCGAELVTKRDLAGAVTIELVTAPSNRISALEAENAALVAQLGQLPEHEPSPGWQDGVLAEIDKEPSDDDR